jgi:hypothetical protein
MGTLHFRHLLPENGGFVRVATSVDEHLQQLRDTLRSAEREASDLDRFVVSFLRPHGLEQACTPVAVEVLERTAARPLEEDARQGRVARAALRAGIFVLFRLPERGGDLGNGLRRRKRRLVRGWRRARRLLAAVAGRAERSRDASDLPDVGLARDRDA